MVGGGGGGGGWIHQVCAFRLGFKSNHPFVVWVDHGSLLNNEYVIV